MIVGYVKGQELKVTQSIIVADTIDYLTASFSFKTADWNGLQKWAHFKHGESVYDVLLTDDKIEKRAHLNLSAGEWELYLHGAAVENGVAVERITTEIATLTVKPTGALSGEVLPDVPPTAAEQISALAQDAVNIANSVRADADSGAFDGRDGQDGRDGVDGRNGVDGADAKINGYNTVNIVAGDNITIDQDGNTLTINGEAGGGGGGTSDHRQLSNRDAANQHPISAIDGLQSALDGKQPIGDYATTQDVSDLADIVDTKADASDIPSLNGYATEQWVENQGYLTEHQSLVGYATESYVDNHHDSTKQDVISDLDTIRSGASKGATAVQPESGKGLFSGNYNDLTNKPTIPSLSGYATEQYVNNHHDATKQDKLTAGDNITIENNVISAAGGGGGKGYDEYNIVLTEPVNAVSFFTEKRYRIVELFLTVKASEKVEAVVTYPGGKYEALVGNIQTGYFASCNAKFVITGEKVKQSYNGFKLSLGLVNSSANVTSVDFNNDYIDSMRVVLPTATNNFVAGSSFYLKCYE